MENQIFTDKIGSQQLLSTYIYSVLRRCCPQTLVPLGFIPLLFLMSGGMVECKYPQKVAKLGVQVVKRCGGQEY